MVMCHMYMGSVGFSLRSLAIAAYRLLRPFSYGNTPSDWGDYRPFLAADNLEFGSSGIYNDNPSLMFHGGYGYSHSSYIDSSEIVRRAWKSIALCIFFLNSDITSKVGDFDDIIEGYNSMEFHRITELMFFYRGVFN
ncbi:hypothetical protein Syun_023915 [Stephania yunnanensis]|uniref:Uncharacterized protein n=1 Tax=Stephania yunnanensis TaxID=152371 RepID=A0AAP0FQN2_9MAGN